MKKHKNNEQEVVNEQKDLAANDIANTNKDIEEYLPAAGGVVIPTSQLQAIESIAVAAENSSLAEEALKVASVEIKYLAKRMGISEFQAVLMAVVVNKGEKVTMAKLSNMLSMTTARTLTLLSEFKKLERLHLVSIDEMINGISISIPSKVLIQLAQDKDFQHEPTTGLDSGSLLTYCHRYFSKAYDFDIDHNELCEEIQNLLDDNEDCSLVKELKKMKLAKPYELLILLLCDALYSEEHEAVKTQMFWICATGAVQFNAWKREFRAGTHDLMRLGLVEHGCDNGIVNNQKVGLTKKTRAQLFKGVELVGSDALVAGLIRSSSIKPKELFYDSEVAQQVDELAKFFEPGNYNIILERMEQNNFRCAFTCLFYGSPGTGKTETVNQLARVSGRDIMLVDVPNLKDKWVGESEKNVKAVFDRYRDMVNRSKVAPILLFNEADSIFGKRLTQVQHSVDQMLNTMQNIILQEMESLDGILIATTNLTENLDDAFDRRFLYKIKFERPGVEAREHIWHAMLPGLNDDEVKLLADNYEFSGGQIENVARKFSINNILYGDKGDKRIESLFSLCDKELIQDSNSSQRRVGF